MKKIGLIVADNNEIQDFKQFVLRHEHNEAFIVWEYEFKNYQIYVIHSRIGVVNAAIATQYLIDNFKVEQIWNYGAVGGSKNLKLNQVIIPKKFFYFDVRTPWYPVSQVPNEKQYYLNSFEQSDDFNIATGHSFINSEQELNKIKEMIEIDLIDMESTAIAQCCYINKVKFYCIKAVSDIIGQENYEKLDINEAIKKASRFAFLKFIESLK